MKPREAAGWLRLVADAVSVDAALPPSVRGWFGLAVMMRLRDPETHLDRLLGLRSRHGGRRTLYSTLPDRDIALRTLAASTRLTTTSAQADEILRRADAGKLAKIEELGRIPGRRQLLRILSDDV